MSEQPEDLEKLATIIRTYRKAGGYSQEKFAAEAEIDRGYYGSIERGERNVTFRMIRRFLIDFGVTWREFGGALDRPDPIARRRP